MHRLPSAPPTDPDVKISLIRFLGSDSLPNRQPNRHDSAWRITLLPIGPICCALFGALVMDNPTAIRQRKPCLCDFSHSAISAMLFEYVHTPLQVPCSCFAHQSIDKSHEAYCKVSHTVQTWVRVGSFCTIAIFPS